MKWEPQCVNNYSMAIMELSLPMDKQAQERHTLSSGRSQYKAQGSSTDASEIFWIIDKSIRFKPISSVQWQSSTKNRSLICLEEELI